MAQSEINFLGGAALVLRTDDRALDRGINRARRKSAQLSRDFAKVGRSITASLTLPILGVGAAAAKVSLEFEASLSQIIGLVGVADDQVKQWESDILALAPAVAKGPGELADAMFFITSAGLRGSEALDALTLSAKASAAGLGETKAIADAVTSAMNAYGSEVVSAASATNSLVGAVREGKAAADAIAGSLGTIIPIAADMGVRFDQVTAAIATLTRLGSGAEETVTSLNSLLLGLKAPTQQAEDALNSMGLSSAELRRQIREGGLLDVLFQLKEKFDENDTAATKVFPNIRALKAALGLLGKNADVTRQIFASLATNTTFLEDAFSAAAKTGKFQFDQALSKIKVGLIAIGDVVVTTVAPMFQKFADLVQNLGIMFRNASASTQSMIIKIGLAVAALGPLLLVLSGVASVLGFIMSPIVLIGVAVGVTAGLIIANWTAIATATGDLFKSIKGWLVDKLGPVFTFVSDKIDAIKAGMAKLIKIVTFGKIDLSVIDTGSISAGFKETGDFVANKLTEMKNSGVESFLAMKDRVAEILSGLFEDTTMGFDEMAESISTSMAGAADGTGAAGKKINESVISINQILGTVTSAFGAMFESFANPDATALDAMKSIALGIIDLLQGIILASEAANVALSLSWVPGGIFGIIAALGALELAKAGVRNLQFAHGGIATPGGSLITANNATANIAEAGRNEAFLPLTRMDNGDLGVASGGGGAGRPIKVEVNISNSVITNKQSTRELIIEPVKAAFRSGEMKLDSGR